jgi:D-glycero-D-manno-heptose 1,7-bisphosphate phosphatase
LLRRAAAELGLDLRRSYLVGDRGSDVQAGALAGCRTVLVRTGRHADPPIESAVTVQPASPDYVCDDVSEAARWILADAA